MRYSPLPDAASIRRAHDRFLDTGEVPSGIVPEVIRRSWIRCARSGVPADRVREIARLDGHSVRVELNRHIDLLAAAEPVMDMLHLQLEHTGAIVLLCAPDGLILRCMGDPVFVPRAERVALEPGVFWTEDSKGTNGIGTAIFERAPVVVYAAQHYVERNQFLACSATPVFSPGGKLAAVLDITGDYRSHHSHTLALARMAGRNIERQLFLRKHQNDLVLQVHRNPSYLGSLFDGRVAFSEGGRFLGAEGTALESLGIAGQTFSGSFEDLFETPFGDMTSRLRSQQPVAKLRLRRGGETIYAQLARGLISPPPLSHDRREPQSAAPTQCAPALEALHAGDPQVQGAISRIKRVLGHDIPVLLQGETGTGKERLARAIHASGLRADKPFVAVNCAALPEGFLEAELFGHEEHAAETGRKPGRILEASGGTLFLDEIGDISAALQERLLRVLQLRETAPLGGIPQRIDVTLICSTRGSLLGPVQRGEFREDLYYRLNGLTVHLPPLRDRTDIAELARRILAEEAQSGPTPDIAPDVMEIFLRHPWPGNLRQLRLVLRTSLALAGTGREIGLDCLPEDFLAQLPAVERGVSSTDARQCTVERLAEIELQAIRHAVSANKGNLSAAAKQLGIGRATLYRKLKS